MSNSLGTIGTNVIAQEALNFLAAQYPFISQVSTDFSNETAQFNSSIISTIPSVGVVSDYSATNGYVATDVTGNSVSVTLNKFKHATFSLTDAELSSTNMNLIEGYAQSYAEGLGQQIMADVAALLVTGSILNSTVTGLASASVANIINKPNTALNKRNVPRDRFGIFNSDFYGALFDDDQIVNLQKGGNGISASNLPVVHGVALSDYSALPTTSNLVGAIGHKSAIVFASRLPSDVGSKAAPTVADIQVVTHPKSGLSILVRKWYDPGLGQLKMSFALIYGVALADQARIQLIRSA